MGLVSNDCNNVGADPNTNCMGLKTDRDPPSGVEGSQLLFNRDREWTVPACFWNADGLQEPIRYANGTSGCPAA
ncbi:MAG: hypothetical protein ACRC35_01470 [Angustibacter sp.]